MKYIFVTGAPGSKWSSVVKNIYFSSSIDQSDYSDARTYHHDASGSMDLMHLGAYYDPGMEFGDFFNCIDIYSKPQCEQEFDRPFCGTGIKIVKSHVFAHHINFLRKNWPECPLVLVYRPNDACLGWWVRCGHFDITYPSYHSYYKNLRNMSKEIDRQNQDIVQAWAEHDGLEVDNNLALAQGLGIAPPRDSYIQNYNQSNIRVKILHEQ